MANFFELPKRVKKEKSKSLRKNCPYLELFWSVFSRIWTEYGKIQSISPYSVRLQESTDQKTPITDTVFTQ